MRVARRLGANDLVQRGARIRRCVQTRARCACTKIICTASGWPTEAGLAVARTGLGARLAGDLCQIPLDGAVNVPGRTAGTCRALPLGHVGRIAWPRMRALTSNFVV